MQGCYCLGGVAVRESADERLLLTNHHNSLCHATYPWTSTCLHKAWTRHCHLNSEQPSRQNEGQLICELQGSPGYYFANHKLRYSPEPYRQNQLLMPDRCFHYSLDAESRPHEYITTLSAGRCVVVHCGHDISTAHTKPRIPRIPDDFLSFLSFRLEFCTPPANMSADTETSPER